MDPRGSLNSSTKERSCKEEEEGVAGVNMFRLVEGGVLDNSGDDTARLLKDDLRGVMISSSAMVDGGRGGDRDG